MKQQKITPTSPIKLALPAAITGSAQSLLVIALPIILALTELKISQLSPVLGLSALAFLVGGYLWPRRTFPGFRQQFIKQLLIMATLSQVLFVIALLAGAQKMISPIELLGILFTTRFIYGLTTSSIYPTMQAWLVSEQPMHNRHIALTCMSAVISAGRILVPLITAGLVIYQPKLIFVLFIGLPLAALLLLPCEHTSPLNTPSQTRISQWPETTIAIPTILIHMSLGLIEFIIGPYLVTEWRITPEDSLFYTALLFASIATCMMLTQLANFRYQLSPCLLLIWAPLGIALGAILAAIYPAALPAGLILVAISLALLLPAAATATAAGRAPHAQPQASADLYTTRILGHLLGVAIAGPLFEVASNLPLLTAAVLAFISIPASIKLRRMLINNT